MTGHISTSYVYDFLQSYCNKGYYLKSVPLIVDKDIAEFTAPAGKNFLYHNDDKVYVGSAEQSFLQLLKDGQKIRGKYAAITPCQRNEMQLNDLTYSIFLKIELVDIGSFDFVSILTDVWNTVADKIPPKWISSLKILPNKENGLDLLLDNKEIGSFGTRTYNGIPYAYGTGLAEPRFSTVLTRNL